MTKQSPASRSSTLSPSQISGAGPLYRGVSPASAMSSTLESAVELLQTNNYMSLVIITAIVFDYFLTFSKEIEYIWHKPWSWVSTMFIVVYRGSGFAIVELFMPFLFPSMGVPFSLALSRFIFLFYTLSFSNDQINHPLIDVCTTIVVVNGWVSLILLSAADLVMIARVYAMWNRSKLILRVLLLFYVVQTLIILVAEGIYGLPGPYFSIIMSTVAGFSFCNEVTFGNGSTLAVVFPVVSRLVLGIALLALAITQILKQSIEMYKATKQWRPNRYIQHLVKDGFFYFLANVLYNVGILSDFTPPRVPNSTFDLLIGSASCLAIFPIMPRFIISVRELYDRDLRARWQGDDTGFGLISRPTASENAVMSTVALADPTPGEGRDQVEEGNTHELEVIRLEALGDDTHQV